MSYTGPHPVNIYYPSLGYIYNRDIYRSVSKPYREVLPYNTFTNRGVHTNLKTGVVTPDIDFTSPLMSYIRSAGSDTGSVDYARAFDRYWSSVTRESGTASMGVTLAEHSSSLKMISGRAEQLIAATQAIRKGNFSGLMKSLNLQREDRRGRTVWARGSRLSQAPANHLLEYTFGWVPMVNDVIAASKVLSSTPERTRVYSSSASSFLVEDGSIPGYPNNWVEWHTKIHRKVSLFGFVRIDNPNVDLANRLGLVNPIQLAWQVVPYSFLFDTFVNVSQYLGRYTADFGRTLEHGGWSEKVIATSERRSFINATLDSKFVEVGSGFRRTPRSSFPRPTALPTFSLPVSHLVGRAITSTALLLQQLQRRS